MVAAMGLELVAAFVGIRNLRREERESRHEQGNREGTGDLCRCGK
jgi:hypothetical protein